MANEGYHEPTCELPDDTRDTHRAIISLMEELEAVDCYNQRVEACKDTEIKNILRWCSNGLVARIQPSTK